jgi:hypothetical protein
MTTQTLLLPETDAKGFIDISAKCHNWLVQLTPKQLSRQIDTLSPKDIRALPMTPQLLTVLVAAGSPLLLTRKQVAAVLRCRPATVSAWVHRGYLPAIRGQSPGGQPFMIFVPCAVAAFMAWWRPAK